MILEALQLLRTELAAYLGDEAREGTTAQVVLGSVINGSEGQVLLSLVNVEEEAALKNSSPYRRNETTGSFDVVNPPVFLNLFVLVAAYSTDNDHYPAALKRLAWVVQCFQRKSTYTPANTPGIVAEAATLGLRVTVDLYSLSFEKISQLWGTLGDKQVPGVLYKVRVVEEQAAGRVGERPEITSVRQPPVPTSLSLAS